MSKKAILLFFLIGFLFISKSVFASSYDQSVKDSFHSYNGFPFGSGINISAFSVSGFNSGFVLNSVRVYGYFNNPDGVDVSQCHIALYLLFLKNSGHFRGANFVHDTSPNYIIRDIQNRNSPDYFVFNTDDLGHPMSLPASDLNDNYQVQVSVLYNRSDVCNFDANPNTAFVIYDTNNSTSPNVGRYVAGFSSLTNTFIAYTPFVLFNSQEFVGKTPVLIVPGVLGTDMLKGQSKLWLDLKHNFTDVGDQFMDPLQFNLISTPSDINLTVGDLIKNPLPTQHFYDLITQEFKNQGYTQGTSSNDNLFLLPYDWRYGVTGTIYGTSSTTVDLLKQKIQEIIQQTGSPKVDIVAHSTGGLLVKKYVMDNPDHKIGKAVFVGVPNTGAPKAIKTLLEGDNFNIPWLSEAEMQKISKNLPVVYDLLPSQRYFDTKGSFVTVTNHNILDNSSQNLDFNQTKNFLINDHALNSQAIANASGLHTQDFDNFDLTASGVDLYSIVGCKAPTLKNIEEVRSSLGGTPLYYPSMTPGDGTVPLESATNLPIIQSHKFYAYKADHAKMPSQDGIRQEIVKIFSGNGSVTIPNNLVDTDIGKCKLNGKAFSVFSPLDFEAIDQYGNRLGVASDGSIQNDIPNADFEIWGEHKFIFLPTDEGQTYSIKLKGTGSGTFTIKDQDVNNDQTTQTQVFSNIPVTTSLTGQVNLGSTDTLSLDNNGDGTIDQTVQPPSILNSSQSQDLIPPVSTSTVTGLMGQPGFYRSNVSINLFARDPIIPGQESQTSGVLKTQYSLDAGATTTYTSAINLTTEGPHTISFFSTDKAGNNEAPQTTIFTIDKTGPEFAVNFDPETKDLVFRAFDGLNPSISAICQAGQCSAQDIAGNITLLKFDKQTLPLNIKNLVIKSVSYNGQSLNFDPNLLTIGYTLSSSNLSLLSQTELIKNQQIFNIIYTRKQNQSVLTDWTKGSKPVTSTLSGLKLLQISTSLGKVKTTIK